MTNEEKEAHFQRLAESFAQLHPFTFDSIGVRVGPLGDEYHGRFDVQKWEMEDGTFEDEGTIYLDTYEGLSREELILLLQTEIFIHELGHAAQHRSHDYELEREQDHDAEWGIKYAAAYNDVTLDNKRWSAEEAFEYLGVTDEKREELVASLTAAIEKESDNG